MHEMAGEHLKLKYRASKPKGTNKSSPSGNSGTGAANKTVPRGMRKKHKPGAKIYR
jgi:hypothetical protein